MLEHFRSSRGAPWSFEAILAAEADSPDVRSLSLRGDVRGGGRRLHAFYKYVQAMDKAVEVGVAKKGSVVPDITWALSRTTNRRLETDDEPTSAGPAAVPTSTASPAALPSPSSSDDEPNAFLLLRKKTLAENALALANCFTGDRLTMSPAERPAKKRKLKRQAQKLEVPRKNYDLRTRQKFTPAMSSPPTSPEADDPAHSGHEFSPVVTNSDVTAIFGTESGVPQIWYYVKLGSGSGRTRKVYFLQGVNTTDGTCTLNREPFDLKVVNNVETRHTFRDVRLTDDSATLDTGDLEEVQRKFELFLGEKMQCST